MSEPTVGQPEFGVPPEQRKPKADPNYVDPKSLPRGPDGDFKKWMDPKKYGNNWALKRRPSEDGTLPPGTAQTPIKPPEATGKRPYVKRSAFQSTNEKNGLE